MHITHLLKQMRVFSAILKENKTELEWTKAQKVHSIEPIFKKKKSVKLMPTPFFGLKNLMINTSYPEFEDELKQKEPEIESERHLN